MIQKTSAHIDAVLRRIDEIKWRFSTPSLKRQAVFAPGGKVTAKHISPEIEGIIAREAEKTGLDPALIKAVIHAESAFHTQAVSRAGAKGLMQLMPGTAAALGVSDPFDPEQNIAGGARYLSQQISRFGDVQLALAAYNAGPGSVLRYGGIPPYPETEAYVSRVLGYLEAYR